MEIRRYTTVDREKILDIFDENTPQYFSELEREDLERYLEESIEEYYIVMNEDEVIGCGGINYFPEDRTARLSWDLVSPKVHGHGAGRMLTQYRIRRVLQRRDMEEIVVRTSQLAYGFYEKMGFHLEKIEKDFWATGYHLYEMKTRLPSKKSKNFFD